MARYAAISLVDKAFIYRSALRYYIEGSCYKLTSASINILLSARVLSNYRNQVTFISIFYLLRANQRSIHLRVLGSELESLSDQGLLRKGAGKGKVLHITEEGRRLLVEFDELLRSWQVKIKKRDEPIAKKRPGPRKGQPMPNRWREGEPRGRIAELRAKEGKE